MTNDPNRVRFFHFTSFAPGGPPIASWSHPGTRDFDYLNLDHWIRLAKALEEAKFDGIFLADHSGVHQGYQGSRDQTLRSATQFPLGDPLTLVAALASSTQNLGFGVSSNIIQSHPYTFARRLATLDHLTRGRIGWNIVTAFQKSAWQNVGYPDVRGHAERYKMAEEYAEVVYKLLEGSWEDDAVVRDLEARVFADPAKVHSINHAGEDFTVPGINMVEPSPQRTPYLFQAGSSADGRAFASRHAETMFIASSSIQSAESTVKDMRARAAEIGRHPDDILFCMLKYFVVGSTEAEAQAKSRELDEWLDEEGLLAFNSSMFTTDLSQVELDTPIGELKTDGVQSMIKGIVDSAPDKSVTFRQLTRASIDPDRIVGTPEQIADEIEKWRDVGVRGINVSNLTGFEDTFEFLEHVVPVLQSRGIMQTEYQPGTLREKLSNVNEGPRLNKRHIGDSFRRKGALLND